MNSFPTNGFLSPNHTSLPSTSCQLGSLNEETPTFINDLSSNDLLDLGGFNVDTRHGVTIPTPRIPPHGTLLRHTKPLVHRRLINMRRRRHGRPGAIPNGSPSQSIGFNAPPQANILATATPQLSTVPFEAFTLNTHNSASLSSGPSSTMFDRNVPRHHVGSDTLVLQATPQVNTLVPQSNTHAALAPQLSFDEFNNTSYPITHPSASCHSGSSSAAVENGELERLSFSSIQNIPIPMTSGPVPSSGPASSALSSLTWMTPIIPTSDPAIRPWDADTASMGPATIPALSSTDPARTEPPRVPVSGCTCRKRVHPLVRVDDSIEWVRPDLMKMVLYFNWSSSAEAEAHESWEP